MSRSVRSQSYKSRIAAYDKNPTAKLLLEIMDRKQSNLCLSIDVTKKEQLLNIVDAVGPYLCVVKVGFPDLNSFVKMATEEDSVDTHRYSRGF